MKPSPRTAIYARYSSHNQDDSTSIEVQLEASRRAASCECREYIDRARTGQSMRREAFDQMLADAEAGLIDTVYVYKWDRFGRSAHAHAVVADLEDIGVRVISATEGDEPLSRGIQLVVAEDFSRKLGERVSEAKLRRFEEGAWHGGVPPYGYHVEGKRLVIDDAEASVVRDAFSMYLRENAGFRHIARDLNSLGSKPRRAQHWTGGTVRCMLRNTVYSGRQPYRHHPNTRGRLRGETSRDPEERRWRQDESLRIIPQDQFDRVREKLLSRRSSRPVGQNRTRRFSKLLQCAECGNTFVRRFSGGREHAARWTCGLRLRVKRSACCNHVCVSESQLSELVTHVFEEILGDADAIIEEAMAEAAKMVKVNRRTTEDIGRRVGALDREVDHLTDLLTDPDIPDPATKRQLSKRLSEKVAERDQLRDRYAALASDARDGVERLGAAVRAAFDEIRSSLDAGMTESEFNEFARQFIGAVVVHGDGRLTPAEDPAGAAGVVPGDKTAEAIQYRLLDRRM